MSAYYNEIDPFAAGWLRNLIAAGHIAPGDVDERSIREVSGDDLRVYRQCHFFAGIGVWSYALRLAHWPDDAPVWTGSCPCQPFSAAGKRGGAADDRHLWPEFFRLIRERRPAIVLGEQVAGKAGYGWWDSVSADLEGEDYAGAAADLAAAGAGAPHIRQRLFWMAYRHGQHQGSADNGARPGDAWRIGEADRLADGIGEQLPKHQRGGFSSQEEPNAQRLHTGNRASGCGEPVGLADGSGARLEIQRQQQARGERAATERGGEAFGLADADGGHASAERQQRGGEQRQQPEDGRRSDVGEPGWSGPLNGHWRDADWLRCTDARWRPVEPGAFPLANGVAGRVGRLRAYGNAINAPLAAEFIQAAREALEDVRAA